MHQPRRLVSRSVSRITISAIKEMAMRSARIPGAASLTWGLPSFRTPAHIRAGVAAALESDPDAGKYALPDGLPELRALAARHFREATGRAVDPDANVIITAGNMQGLNALFHTIIDPGDQVIVTDPGFASHFHQIRLCGGEPVHWAMDESRGWALDVDALPGLINERTKGIVIVSPSNPTGNIFSEAQLRRIGEIAREAGVLLLIDDPYSNFVYENRERFFNIASIQELADDLAYLFTFSKCHAMSGWRLGYMVVPQPLKGEVLKVHDATLICTPRVSQIAGIAALSAPPAHVAEFESVLAARRTLICQRLDALPHVFAYNRPEGAYYVFPRILVEHENSVDFAIRLLEESRVAVTPGSAFGPTGEHHVRMAYCVDEDTINLAFDRIGQRYPR
jgi:aspartate/methionine/tyrosine aminotransferase